MKLRLGGRCLRNLGKQECILHAQFLPHMLLHAPQCPLGLTVFRFPLIVLIVVSWSVGARLGVNDINRLRAVSYFSLQSYCTRNLKTACGFAVSREKQGRKPKNKK